MDSLLQSLLHRRTASKSEIGEEHIKSLPRELVSCAHQLKSAIAASDNDAQIIGAWTRIKKNRKLIQLSYLANCKTSQWPATLLELEEQTKDIVLGKSNGEFVDVYAIAKSGFGPTFYPLGSNKIKATEFRTIMSFGCKKRVKNWLLFILLSMVLSNPKGNFLYKGCGATRLSESIKTQLECGTPFVVLFDVSNFYSSVQGTKWVGEKLKMPEKLVAEELFTSPDTHLTLANYSTHSAKDQFLKAARLGLPQGLATSLIVGRIVYEDVLTTLFPTNRYFFYGDDGIVFASSNSEAEAIASALWGAFESHPAGLFALKRCEKSHVQDGFDFVMYRYRKKLEGNIHITPALNSFKRYEQRIAEMVYTTADPSVLDAKIAIYNKQWLNSFSQWKPNTEALQLFSLNCDHGIALGERKLGKGSGSMALPPNPCPHHGPEANAHINEGKDSFN